MALAIRTIGAEKVKDLDYFQPANPNLEMDPAIDAALLSKDILGLYQAFRTPIKLHRPDELVAAYRDQSQTLARWTNPWSRLRHRPEPAPGGYRQQQLGGGRQAHRTAAIRCWRTILIACSRRPRCATGCIWSRRGGM